MKRIGIMNHLHKWYSIDLVFIHWMITITLWTPGTRRPKVYFRNKASYTYESENGFFEEDWFLGVMYK